LFATARDDRKCSPLSWPTPQTRFGKNAVRARRQHPKRSAGNCERWTFARCRLAAPGRAFGLLKPFAPKSIVWRKHIEFHLSGRLLSWRVHIVRWVLRKSESIGCC